VRVPIGLHLIVRPTSREHTHPYPRTLESNHERLIHHNLALQKVLATSLARAELECLPHTSLRKLLRQLRPSLVLLVLLVLLNVTVGAREVVAV